MCNRTCTPAEWQSLSVQERADLWPVMTQENRRHIWMLMDDAEKRALREKLRPISREEFRRHFECSIDPKGLGAMGAGGSPSGDVADGKNAYEKSDHSGASGIYACPVCA